MTSLWIWMKKSISGINCLRFLKQEDKINFASLRISSYLVFHEVVISEVLYEVVISEAQCLSCIISNRVSMNQWGTMSVGSKILTLGVNKGRYWLVSSYYPTFYRGYEILRCCMIVYASYWCRLSSSKIIYWDCPN